MQRVYTVARKAAVSSQITFCCLVFIFISLAGHICSQAKSHDLHCCGATFQFKVRRIAAEVRRGRVREPANNSRSMEGFVRMRMMAVLMAGICFWAGTARAQAGGVRVSVPFPFGVGGKNFPAGNYVMVAGSNQVRVVSQADGRTLALATANDVSGRFAGRSGKIMFRCYDDRCFLSEVWSPLEQNGRQVLTSRAEAHSSRERSGTYFAILGKPSR